MQIITIRVSAPPGQVVGVKEELSMYLERHGDVRVLSVTEDGPARAEPEQLQLNMK